MTHKFTWESPESCLVEFSGLVTAAEAIQATESLYNDPRSEQVRHLFWDFSAIDGFRMSEDDVTDIAAIDFGASLYMKPMKAAFIIRDPALMALGERYIATLVTLGCRWQNSLFCQMEDARRWAFA